MSTVGALTIYSIRRDVDGQQVTDFDAAIVPDKLLVPAIVVRDFAADNDEWEARLYVWPGEQRPPGWLAFIESGFGENLELPESA